jgi:AmmeMemoRadiSam system protein B
MLSGLDYRADDRILILFPHLSGDSTLSQTRSPAVAGAFYPGQAAPLAQTVAALLQSVTRPEPARPPKAIIVPHAGYIYSGPIAASAYAALGALRHVVKRVVLLGPVHRVAVRGLATPGASAFATPLGTVSVDLAAIASIAHLPQVVESAAAHALEHSLEVQLPFLQQVLDDFTLVPLAVGDATPEEVAEILEALWGGPETLIVISSDLSHYLPYDIAQATDKRTAQAILDLRPELGHEQACGGTPVNGLLLAARRRHMKPQLLDLRNSGDTAGDRDRVVGYAAFSFTEETANVS